MTREEVLAMPAGREMDELVAELAMGLETPFCMDDVPHYSTEIEAAWAVVEKMADAGRVVILKADGLRDGTFNPRWTVLIDSQPRTDADAAPLAVCRAALLARLA